MLGQDSIRQVGCWTMSTHQNKPSLKFLIETSPCVWVNHCTTKPVRRLMLSKIKIIFVPLILLHFSFTQPWHFLYQNRYCAVNQAWFSQKRLDKTQDPHKNLWEPQLICHLRHKFHSVVSLQMAAEIFVLWEEFESFGVTWLTYVAKNRQISVLCSHYVSHLCHTNP